MDVQRITQARTQISTGLTTDLSLQKHEAAEGGCGVIGVASTVKLKGKYFFEALHQMKNRGNGKGGGVAILGLNPEQLGITEKELQEYYIIQVAYLDSSKEEIVEKSSLVPYFEIHHSHWVETLNDYAEIGLETRPPRVKRYFCTVRKEALQEFVAKHRLGTEPPEKVEEELVFQATYSLNKTYYASLGEKQAFVLSSGKNMVVFKIVGYAHQVIDYYKLENFEGHVWIGHHRYPTKGRVWHPGGAHPFVSVNTALVHNGDFSNYYSITQYLEQKNILPLFLTDTEVAVYLFDLWKRVYEYPLELVIEAMAPTTERDFKLLPPEKQVLYQAVQTKHFHGSPDGPWFFIIGSSEYQKDAVELIGITDTSMLRPQVFALQEGEESIGLVASERQAIDAFLRSLSEEDARFYRKADLYWVARGGSHTDGGAFVFSVDNITTNKKVMLTCRNKFGKEIHTTKPTGDALTPRIALKNIPDLPSDLREKAEKAQSLKELVNQLVMKGKESNYELLQQVENLTLLLDRLHLTVYNSVGWGRSIIEDGLYELFRSVPLKSGETVPELFLVNWENRDQLHTPKTQTGKIFIDIKDFPPEGEESAARIIVKAYRLGWKHIFTFDWRGQRFCCSGLGPNSDGLRVEVYGNPGDYLGSGLDGAEVYVHCSAQDQVGQIMRRGKLVIYGDVGQAFLYGAKGGEIYVLGNTAGRPLINAVGKPRVVINGTALDYLAESFMAGDPLHNGGFVILNSIAFDPLGKIHFLSTPYPGSNLFSLASGGAIYVRDPLNNIDEEQLNGGQLHSLSDHDKQLVKQFLEKNDRLFGINLTEYEERLKEYRKIAPVTLDVLK